MLSLIGRVGVTGAVLAALAAPALGPAATVRAAVGGVVVTRPVGGTASRAGQRTEMGRPATSPGAPRLLPPLPFLSARQTTSVNAPVTAGGAPRLQPAGAGGARALTASTPAAVETLTSFAGISNAGQASAIGVAAEPPDTQLAAGPTQVLEAVNDTVAVYGKDGALLAQTGLATFFGIGGSFQPTDPRVLYDAGSGRWFMSVLSFDASSWQSQVYLAVSTSSDASGGWVLYRVGGLQSVVADQPKVGLDSSVVTVSANDFSSSSTFTGAQTWVLQKSQMLSGSSSVAVDAFPANAHQFGLVPVQALSPLSTEYLVASTPSGSALQVAAVTGTPAAGTVTMSQWTLSIPQMAQPPLASQPGGGLPLNTDDNRLLEALWRDGVLWTAGNEGCVPSGQTTPQACLRLISVAASPGTAPVVGTDVSIGQTGTDLYYPAFGLDGAGNILMTYGFSSPSPAVYPSVGSLAFAPATQRVVPGPTLASGTVPYHEQLGQSSFRWGDYSGAAIDPSVPSDVWVAAEFTTTTGVGSTGTLWNWGTRIARLTASAPAVTGVTPGSGPTGGANTVTVTGTDFVPAGTTVAFGGAAATAVAVQSPTSLTATVPAHAAGPVVVAATTGAGTSAQAYDQYIYLSNPAGEAYAALPPYRILDTRQTQALAAGASLTLPVTGTGSGSDAVPAGAVAAVLNVTVTQGSRAGVLTVYPGGSGSPPTSNLNWVKGQTVPNLVTVPLSTSGTVGIVNRSAGSVDVVVDVEGYYAAPTSGAGQYAALTPARILDTRNGTGGITGPIAGGQTVALQVTGRGGVPASVVAAVVMNVTVTQTTRSGFLTAYPTGETRPTASNVNWVKGETVANRVIVPVGPTGQVALYNSYGDTQIVVDVNGYVTDATVAAGTNGWFVPVAPHRLLDTRLTGQTLGPGQVLTVPVAGQAGVPASGATAAVMNVTVTNTTTAGFLTVYPAGVARPNASDVNWVKGQTVPNMVVATLGSGGAVDVYNSYGRTDVVIDVVGWFS
ncbi:MAG TPA: IPT/TIG domain-containing protein [Candidatus Dormibacteraeota bacterium]|nr:IPT/TIG domain-containing protein [Candidatus Dormibacteraeota bacterium]